MCKLLEDENSDIKENIILALRILSDLPSGFLKIVEIIYDKLNLLDEVKISNLLFLSFIRYTELKH